MLKKLLLLVFVLSLFSGFAQNKRKDSLTLIVKNILKSKPSTYLETENRFKSDIATEQKIKIFLEESIKSDSTLYIVYGYNSLGRYYRNISNYSKALKFHKKAMRIAKDANSSKLEIITLNMIGSVYRRLDDVRKALNQNQKALKIANAIKQKDVDIKNSIAVSRNSIGNIYITLKQYNLALRELNIALEIQTTLNSPVGKAINLQNIAFIQEQTGNLKEALKNYNKSLNYNLSLNNKVGVIICNDGIANTLIKQGKNQHALEKLKLVLPLAEELKDPYYMSIIYTSLGKVYTTLKDEVI